MLPKYIKVKNFMSYIDCTIEFEQFGPLYALIGLNGAGKSSIIDMITTTLFNRARGVDNRGSGMDELISEGTDQFEIEFVFIMNNNEYKIIRRKFKNGAHELEFYINGIDQTEKINETQQKINNVIKMNYDTFLDTVCIGQGKSGNFMEKKPNERKDVFVQVLNLDKYEILEEYTKKLKKNTGEELDKIKSKLDELNIKVDSKNKYEIEISENEIKLNDIKLSISNKTNELESMLKEKTEYEQSKQQRELILNQRTNLKRKIELATNNIKNDIILKGNLIVEIKNKNDIENQIIITQNEIDKLQEEYTGLTNQSASLNATNNILITNAKTLKSKYDKLKNYNEAICEFCGHEITESYKKDHLNGLMEEGKKQLNEINVNKVLISEINDKLKINNNSLNNNKKQLKELQNKLNKMLQSETQLENLKIKIENEEESLKEIKEEYGENLKIQVKEIEIKIFNDIHLRNEINQLRQQQSLLESKLAIAKNKLAEVEEALKEINELNDKNNNLKLLYDDYKSLVEAYGKSGIQANIIANALPEIEEEINKILKILSNNTTIEFQTQKETKGKKKKSKSITSIETLDIIIINDKGIRKYETYSGGEKFRVDFACHVGLAKFLAKRAGSTIDFFVVDEGLGSQDDNSRAHFVTSVYKLTKVFKQVMIVTHIEEMKEAFNNKVLVYKDQINGSQVTLL